MKRTTALAILGLACLMAMPSIAHARYRDGMNLYQYVASAPTVNIDPTGTTIEPKSGITGSYSAFIGGSGDTNRFIYTCKCGWLDRTHFTWDKKYKEVYDAVAAASKLAAGKTNEVSPTYHGPIGGVKVTYTIANRGQFAGIGRTTLSLEGEALRYTSMGIFLSLFKTGELQQMGSAESLAKMFSDRAGTVYSLEDMPTNWTGLVIAAEIHQASIAAAAASQPASAPSTSPTEQLLSKFCGDVLSEKDAKCLYDQMTNAEKNKKNYWIHPVLFNSKPACKPCNNAQESDIFTNEAMKSAIYYRTFVNIKSAVYDSRNGVVQLMHGGKPVTSFSP